MLKKINFVKISKNFHPIIWSLIIGTFISRAGFYMSIPFLGIYLHDIKEYDHTTTGAILAISFFVSTFASFFGGAWSDRIGRFPVMIFSMFLWSFVFIGFAFAQEIWQFFILNALSGLCRSIFEPTSRALLVDIVPEEKRLDVFNARYFAINIGGAIGPLVGLYLGSANKALPFFITAIIYLIYGLLISYWKNKVPDTSGQMKITEVISLKDSLRIIKNDKPFSFFLIGNIFVTGAYAHLDTTLSQYLGNNHVTIYSILFVTNALAILIFQYPIVNSMKKYSSLTCLKIGSILFAVGIFGFGLSNSIILLIISVVLFTLGEILCFIIGDVLISEIAPNHLRGAYFGASGLQFIGQSAGAWVGGFLLNLLGVSHGIIIFGILAVLTLAAYPFFQIGQSLLQKRESANLIPIKTSTGYQEN